MADRHEELGVLNPASRTETTARPTTERMIAAFSSITLTLAQINRAMKHVGRPYPPFLCYNTEDDFAKFFAAVSALVDELKKEGGKLGVERAKSWSEFHPPDVPYRGKHRFGLEAEEKWCAAHPLQCSEPQKPDEE